jgi:gluconate 5-dehydrogenase
MPPRLPKLFDLAGQTAVVSGGGSGLGRHMAEALAELGASIVLCARNRDRCEEEAAAIRSDFGVAAIGLRCDVRDHATIDDVVRTTLDRFGTIDVLVNNAGTTWGAPALEMPIVAWQKVIDVNLTGLFALTQAAAGAMASQGRGSVINITSIAALQGMRPEVLDAIAYTASKGAVVSLTRDLAVKWARHGVRVNAIAPGWFPSDMSQHSLDANGPQLLERIPLGRFGEPEEIKGAVAYLASAASSFVTGTVLVVDGGQTAG